MWTFWVNFYRRRSIWTSDYILKSEKCFSVLMKYLTNFDFLSRKAYFKNNKTPTNIHSFNSLAIKKTSSAPVGWTLTVEKNSSLVAFFSCTFFKSKCKALNHFINIPTYLMNAKHFIFKAIILKKHFSSGSSKDW